MRICVPPLLLAAENRVQGVKQVIALAAEVLLEHHGCACAGKSQKFSEQQVMDCSWRDGNEACDGGDYDTAIDYLVQARGRKANGGSFQCVVAHGQARAGQARLCRTR